MATPTATPTVLIDGEDRTPALLGVLELVRVEQSIDAPARAELRLVDRDYTMFDDGLVGLGDILEIKLPTTANAVRSVFVGPVVEIGIDHDEQRDDAPIMRVVALDAAVKLAYTQAFQAYLDQRLSAVVRSIGERHGLTVEMSLPSGADLEDPYLLQASSDSEALDQLAAAAGCEWYAMAGTLHFRPRPALDGATTLTSGEDLLRFSAGFVGTGLPKDVTVRGWDMGTQQIWEDTVAATKDAAALGSDAPFVADQFDRTISELAEQLPRRDVTVRDDMEVQRVATATMTAMLAAAVTAKGLTYGNADVVAGGSVTIAQVGTKLAGTYYLTHVTHEFGAGDQLRTRFASRGTPSGSPAPVAPPPAPSGPPMTTDWAAGLVLGKVSNLNDPDKLGRVKVAFPALGQELESEWARVVSIGAGDAHGFDNRPELNEEVVVGFERGDPRFPLVFGGLWSRKFPPPVGDAVDGQAGVVAKRVITSPAGHAVTIADGVNSAKGDASRFVSIVLSDGTELHLGEDQVRLTTDGLPIVLSSGDATLTLTDDGGIELKAKEVSVSTTGTTTVDASGDLTAKSKAGVSIEGKSKAELKGGMITVQSSGPAEIKGTMVKLN